MLNLTLLDAQIYPSVAQGLVLVSLEVRREEYNQHYLGEVR